MSVIEHSGPPFESCHSEAAKTGSAPSWDDLLARHTPDQLAAVDASVAAADDFTDDQFHRLDGMFSGAGERLATHRTRQEPGTAA